MVRGAVNLLALAIVATMAAAPASAQDKNAADLFASGVKHLKEGRATEAVVDLRQAFELAPTKQVLWTLAQAERFAGHCGRALPLYERFIRDYPEGAKSVEAATRFAGECRTALAAKYQSLLARAASARAAKDYPTAIATYREAESASPDGGALAVLERARTHVAATDCAAAVPVYEGFIAAHPDNPSAASARAELESCRRELAPPEPKKDVEPPPDDPSLLPPAPTRDEGRHWYRSRLGWTLVSAGTAALATGATLVIIGRGGADDPGGASYGEHEDNWNGAQLRYNAGWVIGGLGLAALTAGTLRLATFGIDPVNRSVAASVRF